MALARNAAVERAALVGLARNSGNRGQVALSLEELAQLTVSAGAVVVSKIMQTRVPDPKFFIGKGLVERLKADFAADGTNLVIFDDPLAPAQQRNLEDAFEIKVIDRSILILDIFALRARSAAAKLQVELAQLDYMLPRLTGAWSHFSRQYGGSGIGTKGPGETQLEIDRRRVHKRIALLKKGIERLGVQRRIQRKKRENLFKVSFIGYTNAGKSTLFNRLTKSEVATADALFTTLDPTTREMSSGYPEKILFTDTVGFIKKLPHQLVASFRSTLEEVTFADLLLHVIDYSAPDYIEKVAQAEQILDEIGGNGIDKILIYNKIDGLMESPARDSSGQDVFYVSALKEIGLEPLKKELSYRLQLFSRRCR
jgi:GTP-binding protein HflX